MNLTTEQVYMTQSLSDALRRPMHNTYTRPTENTVDDFESRMMRPTSTPQDNVNHPPHYANGGIECIDAMESMLSEKEFRGYLRGNVFKYLWRYPVKNGVEDLKKAQWYLNKLVYTLRK